jgi:hypothetical protein
VESESPPTADQPPKLRWFQYRLRSLFVLATDGSSSPTRCVVPPSVGRSGSSFHHLYAAVQYGLRGGQRRFEGLHARSGG